MNEPCRQITIGPGDFEPPDQGLDLAAIGNVESLLGYLASAKWAMRQYAIDTWQEDNDGLLADVAKIEELEANYTEALKNLKE